MSKICLCFSKIMASRRWVVREYWKCIGNTFLSAIGLSGKALFRWSGAEYRTVKLRPDTDKFFSDGTDLDHRGKVRSSVIYRLLESVLQISAVSVGVEAETLNFCCNIVKYTAAEKLYAVCKICHCGRMTLVAEAEVYDENDTLLATVLTTLFVVETIKDIPRKW